MKFEILNKISLFCDHQPLTIFTSSIMVTVTDYATVYQRVIGRVAITLDFATHDQIGNGVVVTLEHFCPAENLIAKGIQSN